MSELTAEKLRELFSYDADAGEFIWRSGRRCGHRAGWTAKSGYQFIEVARGRGNPSDNRLCNLREATFSQNMRNKGPARTNKLGLKGVFKDPTRHRFVAKIAVGGKRYCLGSFRTAADAHAAYVEAAKKLHGDFARTG